MWRSTMRMAQASARGGVDIGHLGTASALAPHDAAAAGNERDGNGDDDVEDAGADTETTAVRG